MQSVEQWHAYLTKAQEVVLGSILSGVHVQLMLDQYAATHSMPKISSPLDVPHELVSAVHSLRAMSCSHKLDLNNLLQEEQSIKKEIFSLLQARSSASQQTVEVAQSRPLHVDMGGGAKKFLGMTFVSFE